MYRYKFKEFTQQSNSALNDAIATAQEMGHNNIGSEHLLIGLLMNTDNLAYKLLSEKGITAQQVKQEVEDIVGLGFPCTLTPDDFTPRCNLILKSAVYEAARRGNDLAGTQHILYSMLRERNGIAVKIMARLGIDPDEFLDELQRLLSSEQMDDLDNDSGNKSSSHSDTPTLNQFGRDLTDLARSGKIDPVIGRQKEINRVIQILSRRTKNNPCLIGEPGVGKTAIAEGLALKISTGEVPETLIDKRIVSLDLTGMIAGTKYRGDFEQRIKTAIDEVTKAKNVILFIDEIHTIIGAGSAEGAADAANILKPALARGEMQVVGATTIQEYTKHIEKDAALERRFQPVTVGEPSCEEAVEILKGIRDKYEKHHKIEITDEAIDAAVEMSVRYIGDRFLPDKAIDLIDEAASMVRLEAFTAPPDIKELENKIKKLSNEKAEAVKKQEFENAAKLRDEQKELEIKLQKQKSSWKNKSGEFAGKVTAQEIAQIVSQWTGVPVVELTKAESEKLLNMEQELHKRIVGQDEAVSAVSKAIRRGRVGLKDPKRPTGSFIFLGPTGVGKTELCKTLAATIFGDENAMIRLDMSEYMEKHTVSRLVGSPPGYVGYDDGGQLTEKVRRRPYSVILFDEIEKAHPDVFNILLQILDDGILTDSQGRKVDFKNCIIIMTSNIGAKLISGGSKKLGFNEDKQDAPSYDEIKELVLKELKNAFRPEFLNRVDDIIVFHSLEKDDIKEIARRMLKGLAQRAEQLDISLEFTDEAVERIADAGFDPVYGARPLRRAIQQKIEDRLSEQMLEEKVKANGHYVCDVLDDEFVFCEKEI